MEGDRRKEEVINAGREGIEEGSLRMRGRTVGRDDESEG